MALKIRGRFAPSPTGRLHLGHVCAALLSWLHCRLQKGEYLLRMDDLDTGRCKPEYSHAILSDLEWLGLDWDHTPYYQSQRITRYEEVFHQLHHQGRLYACYCSRQEINRLAKRNPEGSPVYPGTCRDLGRASVKKTPAWRIRTQGEIRFQDLILGERHMDLAKDYGDFVVRRNDRCFAYHLACAVDDLDMDINLVSRGQDLVHCTPPQLYIMEQLSADFPQYAHLPLILDENGEKLSKRHGSTSLAWYQSQGKSAEELVATIAHQMGLIDTIQPVKPLELLQVLDLKHFLHAICP